MLSISQRLAAMAFLSVVTSCVAPRSPVVVTPVPTRNVPESAATNIHDYVAKHRDWRRSVYHIERYPDEASYALFAVVHHRDQTGRPYPGGGKSFVLYCDSHSYRVIKELWFQ